MKLFWKSFFGKSTVFYLLSKEGLFLLCCCCMGAASHHRSATGEGNMADLDDLLDDIEIEQEEGKLIENAC